MENEVPNTSKSLCSARRRIAASLLACVAILAITVGVVVAILIPEPESTGTVSSIVEMAVGAFHTCVLLDNAQVKCWGEGSSGQLGYGNMEDLGDEPGEMGSNLPFVDLGAGQNATKISAGSFHTCVVLAVAQVKCWGASNFGQLGYGDSSGRGNEPGEMGENLPVVDLGFNSSVLQVSAGGLHTCALLDSAEVKCWGRGTNGALGYGNGDSIGDDTGEMGDNLPPVDLGTGVSVVQVSAGGMHTCALFANGGVKCWGDGSQGQLGYGSTTNIGNLPGEMGASLPFVDLGSNQTAVQVSAGAAHSCAILTNGRVKCWGSGESGRLGYEDPINRGTAPGEMGDNLPFVNLGTNRTVTQISAGLSLDSLGSFVNNGHTCAVLDNSRVKCWGEDVNGVLGFLLVDNDPGDAPGEMGDSLPFVETGTGESVLHVASGLSHTCALLSNETVRIKCWGSGGRLGYGDFLTRFGAGLMGDNLPFVDFGSSEGTSAQATSPTEEIEDKIAETQVLPTESLTSTTAAVVGASIATGATVSVVSSTGGAVASMAASSASGAGAGASAISSAAPQPVGEVTDAIEAAAKTGGNALRFGRQCAKSANLCRFQDMLLGVTVVSKALFIVLCTMALANLVDLLASAEELLNPPETIALRLETITTLEGNVSEWLGSAFVESTRAVPYDLCSVELTCVDRATFIANAGHTSQLRVLVYPRFGAFLPVFMTSLCLDVLTAAATVVVTMLPARLKKWSSRKLRLEKWDASEVIFRMGLVSLLLTVMSVALFFSSLFVYFDHTGWVESPVSGQSLRVVSLRLMALPNGDSPVPTVYIDLNQGPGTRVVVDTLVWFRPIYEAVFNDISSSLLLDVLLTVGELALSGFALCALCRRRAEERRMEKEAAQFDKDEKMTVKDSEVKAHNTNSVRLSLEPPGGAQDQIEEIAVIVSIESDRRSSSLGPTDGRHLSMDRRSTSLGSTDGRHLSIVNDDKGEEKSDDEDVPGYALPKRLLEMDLVQQAMYFLDLFWPQVNGQAEYIYSATLPICKEALKRSKQRTVEGEANCMSYDTVVEFHLSLSQWLNESEDASDFKNDATFAPSLPRSLNEKEDVKELDIKQNQTVLLFEYLWFQYRDVLIVKQPDELVDVLNKFGFPSLHVGESLKSAKESLAKVEEQLALYERRREELEEKSRAGGVLGLVHTYQLNTLNTGPLAASLRASVITAEAAVRLVLKDKNIPRKSISGTLWWIERQIDSNKTHLV